MENNSLLILLGYVFLIGSTILLIYSWYLVGGRKELTVKNKKIKMVAPDYYKPIKKYNYDKSYYLFLSNQIKPTNHKREIDE